MLVLAVPYRPVVQRGGDGLVGHRLEVLDLRVHGDRPENDVRDLCHSEDLLIDIQECDIASPATGSPILRNLDFCHF